ncbi:hypothetical protein [Stutzerimonas stutzeri]|uniref:hypothetical protein n=1 Tax=Stutzerimonas stutzeri TaxID=316 RepID=UPI00210DD018|nr:hypothetical protein [Stutzerimonas stutzeri]MCQ4321983.1 hypothetical protein [Stutzerimonas stutzeri]
MRMGQHDRVKFADIQRQGLPVAFAQPFVTLKQAAIHQNARGTAFSRYLEPVTVSVPPRKVILVPTLLIPRHLHEALIDNFAASAH